MFETFIVQPIFNLLVLIYALIPGHNFGLAIILFTLLIRLLLWPLVKKQLHQTKLMRRIQPELKRIAAETKGDRQKQALMQMELYKEKGVRPAITFGVAVIQIPILLALYSGLRRVIKDPHELIHFAYPSLQHLPWMEKLAHNVKLFDSSLFGIVDLHRAAIGGGKWYIPGLIIVIASVATQYLQAKQLLPNDKDSRGLKVIMKDAGAGKAADQQEVNAAVGRLTIFLLPAMIFIFTVSVASALSLYWFVGGLIAYIQQSIILREDSEEMEALSVTPTTKEAKSSRNVTTIPEAEVVETASTPTSTTVDAATAPLSKSQQKKAAKSKTKKRRRK